MLESKYEVFYNIVIYNSYTKAAKALYVTQPAISQQIKHLEDELGYQLFTHHGRHFELTKKGAQLFSYIQVLRNSIDKFKEKNTFSIVDKKKIAVGASLTIGNYILPKWCRLFPRDLNIEVSIDNTHILIDKCYRGELEMVFVEGFFSRSIFSSYVIKSDEVVAIAPKWYLDSNVVDVEKLEEHRLWIREEGSGTRNITLSLLDDLGYSLNDFHSVGVINSIEALKKVMYEVGGIGFIYKSAVTDELARQEFKVIDNFPVRTRTYHAIWLKGSEDVNATYQYFKNNNIFE